MRPPAPVPGMEARSMLCSLAMRRTNGELWMRSPEGRDGAAPGPEAVAADAGTEGLAACGGGGAAAGFAAGAGAAALGAGAAAGAAALAAPAPSPAASITPTTV